MKKELRQAFNSAKKIFFRDALRNQCSESDLIALISAAVKRKKKQHAGKN